MNSNDQSAIEPIKEEDRLYLQSLHFPGSYGLMPHLQNERLVDDLLASVNLSKAELLQPDSKISGLPFKQLLDINIARHNSPVPYSMSVAQEFNVATHGMLGLATTAARNLGEALQLLLKFTPLVNPALIVGFEQDADYSYLAIDFHAAFGSARPVMIEIATMVVMQFVAQAREGVKPHALEFGHQTSFAPHYFQDCFQCPVKFTCGQTDKKQSSIHSASVTFKNQDLNSPMQYHDESTSAALQQHLDSQLNRYGYQSFPWTAETRKFIQSHLKTNPQKLSRESLAGFFNVTERTLTRKLSQENTSFQRLLDDIRCQEAKHALANTHKAISDIAFDLEFNEPQAFSRAFRRWTGETARDYRERLK
ncbi:MAG: AraC family transcriptional regulator [Pseudomonadales bacterium]|nr:AraC family transcriptional regulator [Pseudomonadales bacterium]